MRAHKKFIVLAFFTASHMAFVEGGEVLSANTSSSSEDTVGRLLRKQAEAAESSLDAQISTNKKLSGAQKETAPLGIGQAVKENEPVVEAIWGLRGQEVAEISYKGRLIPVSMQAPYISQIDGWKLKSITPYQVTLVQTKKGRARHTKVISFDWQTNQELGSPTSQLGGQPGGQMVVPAITAPINAPVLNSKIEPIR